MGKKKTVEVPRTAIQARNPYQDIEDAFADYVRPTKEDGVDWLKDKPFDLLVIVAGREDSPGPRDERWEYILSNQYVIEKVLNKEPLGEGPHFFVFPERWLVPGEAMKFGSLLYANPDAKKFGRVYVVAYQPYIVGDCCRQQCRILKKVT